MAILGESPTRVRNDINNIIFVFVIIEFSLKENDNFKKSSTSSLSF